MEEKQYVIFRLGNEEYGLDIMTVQEIIIPTPVTKLPNTPPYFTGVFNLRGRVIPLIDLKKRFSLDSSEEEKDTRIIVVRLENPAGILVDAINEVLMISSEEIESSQQISSGISKEFITGIAKKDDRLIILLDLNGAF